MENVTKIRTGKTFEKGGIETQTAQIDSYRFYQRAERPQAHPLPPPHTHKMDNKFLQEETGGNRSHFQDWSHFPPQGGEKSRNCILFWRKSKIASATSQTACKRR